MYITGILTTISRIIVNKTPIPARNISLNSPSYINVTNILFAEPLKKKKKMDPAIIRAREERRKRKLEKFIRKLEKHSKQLKPLSELYIPLKLQDEIQLRKRDLPTISVEKLEERAAIFKEWTMYKKKQNLETIQLIDKYIFAQEKALNKLKTESEELYKSAIEIDPELLPFSAKGPVHTLPITNFEPKDGEYIDVSRKFDGET